MSVNDQTTELVLNMVADGLDAISAGRLGDPIIIERLSRALGARLGASVYTHPEDHTFELVAGFPTARAAAPLLTNVASLGPSDLAHHVTVDQVTGLGHVVYVAIPTEQANGGDDEFGRILAFARETPFDATAAELLERACRPLQALWPLTARAYARARATRREYKLTARELEVLDLLAQGLLATSIASRLNLSPRTVHKHLGNIYNKLGAHDRLVAVSIARGAGLLPEAE